MQRTSNPILKENLFRKGTTSGKTMTIGGTIGKTLIMLLLLVATGVYAYTQTLQGNMGRGVLIGSGIAVLITAFATIFVPRIAPITAPIYAAVQGILVGSISASYSFVYDGIILQAVLITVSVMFAMLLLYATRIIKASSTFMKVVGIATLGIFVMYLVTFILGIFNVSVPFLHSSSPLSIGISIFICIVAALNFIWDFHSIEMGARSGSPKYMEWMGALGLMATLIWLYIEMLSLLSKLANRN